MGTEGDGTGKGYADLLSTLPEERPPAVDPAVPEELRAAAEELRQAAAGLRETARRAEPAGREAPDARAGETANRIAEAVAELDRKLEALPARLEAASAARENVVARHWHSRIHETLEDLRTGRRKLAAALFAALVLGMLLESRAHLFYRWLWSP